MAICSVQSIAYTWQHGQIRMLVKAQIFPVLQDERIAAVEHALGFLGSYTELGGSFLARRFRQEAWPQLQRLLQRGPDMPLGSSEPLAPAVVHRAQLAVVIYLHRCALCQLPPRKLGVSQQVSYRASQVHLCTHQR